MKIGFNKIYTGLSISPSGVNAVQVQKNKSGWELLRWAHHSFLSDKPRYALGKLHYSFRNTNAPDFIRLATAINRVMEPMELKKAVIGLALPNEVIKVSIKTYKNLPETDAQINEMIAWEMEKALQLPHASVRLCCFRTEHSQDPAFSQRLLSAIGVDAVLDEYEYLSSGLNFEFRAVAPAAVCQFNFYAKALPSSGVIAFSGLFENFLTLFIIENGVLKFYQGIKKRPDNNYYLNDIERALQFYSQEKYGKHIKTLYIGSQIGARDKLQPLFRRLAKIKTVIPDESQFITLNTDCQRFDNKSKLSALTTAIGAAMNLAPDKTGPLDTIKIWTFGLKGRKTR